MNRRLRLLGIARKIAEYRTIAPVFAVVDPMRAPTVTTVMNMLRLTTALAMVLAMGLACDSSAQTLTASVDAIDTNATIAKPDTERYAFVDPDRRVTTLEAAFRAPNGYHRVAVEDGSFSAWVRTLPLRLDRQHVESFKGTRLRSPSAAIVALDVGTRNLQQCADSAIRLHAEYLWANGRTDELAYHFTSGDEVTFDDWVGGERIVVDGAKVRRKNGARRPATHASFRNWLDLVFMYAGTRSLHRDSVSVSPREAQPGDFFVAPGSPGHAVVILDVATHRTGKRVALLGQGFMPAQDFHVLRGGFLETVDGAWFVLPDKPTDTIATPSWKPFSGADLRRFTPR